MKSLGWFLAIVAILIAVVFASYAHAHQQATAVIAKMPVPFESMGFSFLPLQGLTGRRGPSWVFYFEQRDSENIRLSLEVSVAGNVRAVTPPGALAPIHALK